MKTKEVLDRLASFIRELTEFYGELSQELPDLRVVVDNTRAFSELKKSLRKGFILSEGYSGGRRQRRLCGLKFY